MRITLAGLATLALLWGGAGLASASGPDARLDEIVEEALKLPPPIPLYAQNVKMGVRGVLLQHIEPSPSDPSRLYMASREGYVYSTSDGGITWSEARLIIKRRKFFGALRPSPAPSGAPFSVGANLGDMQSQGLLKYRFGDMLKFPYGTSGNQILELDPGSPAFWDADRPHPLTDPGLLSLGDASGGGGDGSDASRLGIGLKTSAKWLARLLRKKNKKPLTMNLQLTLAVKGVEPTVINSMAVHPTDAKNVLGASDMGLWQSLDGGESWFLLFAGSTRKERRCFDVEFHPEHHDTILLATGQGIRISRNGGETFEVIKGTQLSTAKTHWVEIAHGQTDTLYAGTTIGVFRSDNLGQTWRWIYYETLPTQNHVSAITVHPDDPNKISIGTRDGIFQTDTGGRPWKRSGGFLFTGIWVTHLVTDPSNGDRMVALTWRKAWETRDGGETWTALYINDSEWSPRDVTFDPIDPSILWIATSGELLKITSNPPEQPDRSRLDELERRIEREPSLPETFDLVFRSFGVHTGVRGEKRDKAMTRGWLPRVDFTVGAMGIEGDAFLDYTIYSGSTGDQGLQQILGRYQKNWGAYGFLKLRWDLGRVVNDLEVAPFGRVFETANWAYLKLRYQTQMVYEERRRILERYITRRPSDLRSRLFLKLRLVELTAQLDAFTEGAWAKELAWAESL